MRRRLAGEKKGRKEEMQIQVWEGERGEVKEDSEVKNQRGELTKDGHDVAQVRVCDMEMTTGRWRNGWMKARGHRVDVSEREDVAARK